MESLNSVISRVVAQAGRRREANPDDYIENDILYCGKCMTQKECWVSVGDARRKVSCMCRCESDVYQREEQEIKKRRRMEEIARMRSSGIGEKLRGCLFERDNGSNRKQMEMAKRYVTNWERMRRENCGFLFLGPHGNGKTFVAACIANALVDKQVPVLMTSMPKVLDTVGGMFGEEREQFVRSLHKYELLVLDDLGVERSTDYGKEIVFNIINTRYTAGKPLIVTTNLTADELERRYYREFDRMREMCIPVQFTGESQRPAAGERKRQMMAEILYGRTTGSEVTA